MKHVAEYWCEALRLENLAATEQNPDVKAALEQQAASYRSRAQQRAKELGLPLPTPPAANAPDGGERA